MIHRTLTILALLAVAPLARAHPGADGHAGFLHPLTGSDHLLTLLLAGLLLGRARVAPAPAAAGFVLCFAAGMGLGRWLPGLPAVEGLLLASVPVAALLCLIPLRERAAAVVAAMLLAILHGYGHGLAIPATGAAVWVGGALAASALLVWPAVHLGRRLPGLSPLPAGPARR